MMTFTMTQWFGLETLAPLVAGLVVLGLGVARARAAVGLAIAVIGLALAVVAAVVIFASALPEAPLLVTVAQLKSNGLVYRLDAFSAGFSLLLVAWAGPVLLWMATPRGRGAGGRPLSSAPLGLVLIALSLALGAVLNDNILIITLCWGGVGLVAWLLARASLASAPERHEWLDLTLIALGPALVALALVPLMRAGHTQSLFDLAGQARANFGTGLLVTLALAFAAGAYPFTLWVRRVTQGIMTDAIGIVVLLSLPLGLVMAARCVALLVVTTDNTWPTLKIGPATIPLSVAFLILGVATVLVSGITLLFERDLPVMVALLATLTLGWGFAAIGTGDGHAMLGLVLLLLAYELAAGAALAVITSLEWADRDLTLAHVPGLARELPLHLATLALALLTLGGLPLLLSFAGMVPVEQEIFNLGGAAALAGALLFGGTALAFIGVLRGLSRAFASPIDPWHVGAGTRREGFALLLPAVALLVMGIAPELLMLGKTPGPALTAASALLANGNVVPDVTVSALGFGVDNAAWMPGLLWILAVATAVVIVLSAALVGAPPPASPVFAGGEPLDTAGPDPIDSWDDLARLARSPLVLPGPASWHDDIGDLEGWPGARQDDADESTPDDATSLNHDMPADVEPDEMDALDQLEYLTVVDADVSDDATPAPTAELASDDAAPAPSPSETTPAATPAPARPVINQTNRAKAKNVSARRKS